MSEDLVFYTNPMSRGRIVRWMLEEVGATYDTRLLEYGTTMKAPEFLAINPMGKVPAIVHKGVAITECAAICAYLADAFAQSGLAPSLDKRADYYRWLFFFAGPVESAVINKSLDLQIPDGKAVMSGYGGSLAGIIDVLEARFDRSQYVAGDAFTAADVYCGSQIGWGLQFETIEPRPSLVAYFARLSERPAYLRANELDDALMPNKA